MADFFTLNTRIAVGYGYDCSYYVGTTEKSTQLILSPEMKAILILLLSTLTTAQAQLAVTVAPPKVLGQKAVVPLAMKNNFTEKIESARAVVFLLNEQGKMIGQSSKWVIGGGKDRTSLAAGATNAFNFVITSDKPFATTNLTAKVSFSRVILEDGKLVEVKKDVQIQSAPK